MSTLKLTRDMLLLFLEDYPPPTSHRTQNNLPQTLCSPSFEVSTLRPRASVKNNRKLNVKYVEVLVSHCVLSDTFDAKFCGGGGGYSPLNRFSLEVADETRRERRLSLAREGWLGNFHASPFFPPVWKRSLYPFSSDTAQIGTTLRPGIPPREGPAVKPLQSALSASSIAKHFFLGFLFLLPAKKQHTHTHTKICSSLRSFSSKILIFAFTGLSYRREVCKNPYWRPASVGNLWRSSGVWPTYFGQTEVISMHDVTPRSDEFQCVFNLQEDFLSTSLIL